MMASSPLRSGMYPVPSANAPLVVIATPVFNGARFLNETMQCVQAQTYPNLLHCVLDNASTDATPEIIARFMNRRVPVITARNVQTIPMLDNWNAALRLIPSEAAYFRILPADDLILPHGMKRMVALGERHRDVGIIGCQEWAQDKLLGTELPRDRDVFDGKAIVRGSLLNAIHGFPHFHCLYRKLPGPMPEAFYKTEFHGVQLLSIDMDAAMRELVRSDYAYVHEPLVITRLHSGSVTSAQANPNRVKLWSELQLIDRWGPVAFTSEAEFQHCRRRHLRFYYRHLLLWRARGKIKLLEQHLDWLSRASALPTYSDYLWALAEWPVQRLAKTYRSQSIRLGARAAVYRVV